MARIRERTFATLKTSDGTTHAVMQERHPARSYGRPFVIVFTEAMALAGKQIKQGMTLRVLHQLPGQLNFVDFRPLNQVALATELETGQGAISRAMAQLLDLGIVEKEGAGAHIKWRLSSNWGWNGNADQWHALRAGRLGKKKAPAPRTGTAESRIIHIM